MTGVHDVKFTTNKVIFHPLALFLREIGSRKLDPWSLPSFIPSDSIPGFEGP